MRTTIDLPDDLFRETKAAAALRGSSMRELVVRAVEQEVRGKTAPAGQRMKLPLIHSKSKRKIDLTGFDFDDLLG